MKKKIIFIVVLIVALFAFISYSQNSPAAILSRIKTAGLSPGAKRFCYKVYLFGIFPAGRAELIEAGLDKCSQKELYRLSATTKGTGLIAKIYPFLARLDSYLEPKSLLPIIYLENIKTKDKEIAKEVIYDQERHIMQIKGERRSILPNTYEPLSALLKLRRIDLEEINSFDLNINTNQKNYAFTGQIKKNAIDVKGEGIEIYTLKGNIFRRDRNPYHQSKVDFIFLANEAKTPIFIKVFASGALITARLIESD